jgi:hypothetical protein
MRKLQLAGGEEELEEVSICRILCYKRAAVEHFKTFKAIVRMFKLLVRWAKTS